MKMILAAAAAVLLWPLVTEVTIPPMKEGLWSVQRQSVDSPGDKKTSSAYTLCRSHAFDESSMALARNVKGCTTVSETLRGGTYSLKMHCVVAGTVLDTAGTTTFQNDTSVHSESHTTYAPAMAGMTGTTMIEDAKYVGSCPAGAKPGDRTDASGRVTHLGGR